MADTLRILRIGDSITWQQSGEATLQNMLDAAGIDFQFVGTQNWFDDGGYVPVDLARENNQYSEGYPGMTVEWFTDPNFSWAPWQERPTRIERGDGNTPIRHALTRSTPDIILLMIGTNNTQRDANNQRGVDSLPNVNVEFLLPKYNELLDQIELLAPQAHVIVAEIIDVIDTGEGNGANRSARTLFFNENIVRAAVQPRIEAGKSYTLVDFFPLLDVPADFMDSVHPNDGGIRKMNAAWFDAMLPLLNIVPEVSVESIHFEAEGGASTIEVAVVEQYTYFVTTEAPWILITDGPEFSGDQVIEFTVEANRTGLLRSGTLVVDEQIFTITQAAHTIDFFPGATVSSAPGFEDWLQTDWLGWVYPLSDDGILWAWSADHHWWGMLTAADASPTHAYFSWDSGSNDWWYIIPTAYPWLYAFNINGSEPHGWLYFVEVSEGLRVFFAANQNDMLREDILYGQP